VVLGGGNVRLLKELPPGCRRGDNENAFAGGFRLWGKNAVKVSAMSAQALLQRRHGALVIPAVEDDEPDTNRLASAADASPMVRGGTEAPDGGRFSGGGAGKMKLRPAPQQQGRK
jgi:hypothetical protein